MIIRIFIAEVPLAQQAAFEVKFKAISVPLVQNYDGLISLEIGKGTKWNPLQYVMVTQWESEAHLVDFAGENWNEAHIPDEMAQFFTAFSMYQFHEMNLEEG
ncbi:MAG: antibiotic biosynthesis monooxygenase [Cytophagales bacterium]|nr:antibiotic biosynthesis monooxygenase [Cytophagales bacterium]